MQLKCPNGHSRLKQGLQGSSRRKTSAFVDSGGVNRGLLDPKMASIFLSSAAAMCIKPESLLITKLAQERSAMASLKSVVPQRLSA